MVVTVIRAVVSCLALSALLANPGLTQPLHDRELDAVTASAAAFPDWLPQSLTISTSAASSPDVQAGTFGLGEAGLTGSARFNEFRSVVQFLGNTIVVSSPTRP